MHRNGSFCACALALALSACSGSGSENAPVHPDSGGASVGTSGTSNSTNDDAGAGFGGTANGGASDSAAGANGGSLGRAGSSHGVSGGPSVSGSAGSGGSAGMSGVAGATSSAGSAGSSSNSGSKPFKGVANSPCAARTALDVSWYYNWMQSENEPCKDGKGGEFVPMIWGHTGAEQSASGIQSAIASIINKGYSYVLGFNEPDNTGQANLSTATAISLLPSFDVASLKVGTPATQANTSGQAWFKDYMAKVAADPSLRNDFIAIHWYGWNAGSCDASASQLESYIKYAEGFAGNRPIWITEWSCLHDSAPTKEGVLAFYKGALAVFAKHPRIERYAWYPWTTNCELNDDSGALTALGEAYAAAPAVK